MNHAATEIMRQAACLNLPPEVIDKYFSADRTVQPFEHYTARAICRQCIARLACLEDAIGSPAVQTDTAELIRGGEIGGAIRAMRRKHFLEGASVHALAATAIQQQDRDSGVGDFKQLRKGHFRDSRLAIDQEPDDG